MKRKSAIHDSWLYRFRYPLAIGILSLLAIFMVGYRFWFMSSGLSQAEIESAKVAGNLSLSNLIYAPHGNPLNIVALPWTLLQHISVNIFGPTLFAMRLPAVVLALVVALLGIVLLRMLTRPSLAVIGGFLMVSSAFYVGMGRAGTAAVMTTLLIEMALMLAYLLISGEHATHITILNKLALVVVLAALCYTPGGLYLVLALGLVGLMHPRTRLVLMRGKFKSLPYLVLLLVLIAPIIYVAVAVSGGHEALRKLLLLDSRWSLANISTALVGYAGTETGMIGAYIAPVLTIVDLILVAMGLVVVVRAMSSVRAFLILIFGSVSILMVFAQPELIFALFVPSVILETIGVGWLVDKWYSLFPRNPYARTFAIVPLAVLIVSIGWLNINRYFNTLNYNRKVAYSFNYEYPAVVHELDNNKSSRDKVIVVNNDDVKLYQVLSKHYDVKIVSSSNYADSGSKGGVVYVVQSCGFKPNKMKLQKIVAGWTKDDSELLRIYSK